MALTKRDEAKVGTFGYHEPKPAELFDERAIGGISIFQCALNSKQDALKTVKRVVKALNAGDTVGLPRVTTVPTGRHVGRPKGALVTA
jgi:hypothetical protein